MLFPLRFLFLNFHNITHQICTFISSILGVSDQRLYKDVHRFTTRIRLTEDILQSGNFWLHLKHWKFKMPCYNFLWKNENYQWLNPIYMNVYLLISLWQSQFHVLKKKWCHLMRLARRLVIMWHSLKRE